MKVHKLAEIIPAMNGSDYAELKESIRLRGLIDPITTYEGEILDGRNRFRACSELGIEPKFSEYAGKDPVAFVLDKNVNRRHLDESQRSLIAGRLATLGKGQKKSDSPIGLSQSESAAKLNVGITSVKRAREVIETGIPALVNAVETGKIAVSEAAAIAKLEPEDQHEIIIEESKQERQKKTKVATEAMKQIATERPADLTLKTQSANAPKSYYTISEWKVLSKKDRESIIQAGFESSVKMNEQQTSSIEWSHFSLNTVTGCLHTCPYCYARDFAERYFPYKFDPVFHPARLAAPHNHDISAQAAEDISLKNIFANSMSDLFGKWVPQEWIEATIEMAHRNQEWNFLVLTKYPRRAAEFQFPKNWWMGTTVDIQSRVIEAERSFGKINCGTKWLSCEPLLEPLTFSDLKLFQWIAIGGASASSKAPAWIPPLDWIVNLHIQAREAGCRIYYKTNIGMSDDLRLKEFPWVEPKLKKLPKEFN
jgi:protein gp37/ParB-like chromosome segregation protein Spo0J